MPLQSSESSRQAAAASPLPSHPLGLCPEDLAAEILGKKKATLQRWRHEGRGPRFVRIGRSIAYKYAALQEYVDGREYQSTTEAGVSE